MARKWHKTQVKDGEEGGRYVDVVDDHDVIATVPQDYPDDVRNLALILEAPEAVRACLYMSRVVKAYGSSTMNDLFENNEDWWKAQRLFELVASSYRKAREDRNG